MNSGTGKTYTIEEGIPLPARRRARTGGLTETLRTMKAGQSILVDHRSTAYLVARRIGITITSRAEGDKWRVWRVE